MHSKKLKKEKKGTVPPRYSCIERSSFITSEVYHCSLELLAIGGDAVTSKTLNEYSLGTKEHLCIGPG